MDDLWATKSEGVGLIDSAISFQLQPMWSWSTNVTDRRTDGQTSDSKTALCTVVHRAVKTTKATKGGQVAITIGK